MLNYQRVCGTSVSHGSPLAERLQQTQDGDWDTDDLERLVFEMPPSCRLLAQTGRWHADGSVPKKLFCNWLESIGWSPQAEAGKCPERIGMARATRPYYGDATRGGERIEKHMPCPARNVMNNKVLSIRSKSLEQKKHGAGLNSNSINAEFRYCMFTIAGLLKYCNQTLPPHGTKQWIQQNICWFHLKYTKLQSPQSMCNVKPSGGGYIYIYIYVYNYIYICVYIIIYIVPINTMRRNSNGFHGFLRLPLVSMIFWGALKWNLGDVQPRCSTWEATLW